jgi:hypothetical protein
MTSCTVLPIQVDRCRIDKGRRQVDVTGSGWRLTEKRLSREHLEWRLCASDVSDLNKTSRMHINSFNNMYYIHLLFLLL